MSGKERTVHARDLYWLIAGFSVWAAGFSALYGLHAIGCRAGWEEAELIGLSVNRWALIGVYLAHIAVGIALYLPLRAIAGHWQGEGARTMRRASVALTLAALASTIWIGAPVLVLEGCV